MKFLCWSLKSATGMKPKLLIDKANEIEQI